MHCGRPCFPGPASLSLLAVARGRRWWTAPFGACLALGVARADAAELRRLEVTPAPGGATAVLLLSAPVRAAIRNVTGPDGTPARVYVDLPPGTRLGRGTLRAVAAAANQRPS